MCHLCARAFADGARRYRLIVELLGDNDSAGRFINWTICEACFRNLRADLVKQAALA